MKHILLFSLLFLHIVNTSTAQLAQYRAYNGVNAQGLYQYGPATDFSCCLKGQIHQLTLNFPINTEISGESERRIFSKSKSSGLAAILAWRR